MACKRNTKMRKMQNGTKSVSKYNTGVKKILVPEVTADPNKGAVMGGLGGLTGGAQIGAQFGPVGMGIGAAAGLGLGAYTSYVKEGEQKEAQERARKQAQDINASYRNLGIGATTYDTSTNNIQQFQDGTKFIEIEGKTAPEIHTDSNFNIKNLGTRSHSNGGNIVKAEEGDVIFDTQNNPEKAKSILSDIKRYKLNGDKKAKTRLNKERDSLPEDKPISDKLSPTGDNMPEYIEGTDDLSTRLDTDIFNPPNQKRITDSTFSKYAKGVKSLALNEDTSEWDLLLNQNKGLNTNIFTPSDSTSLLTDSSMLGNANTSEQLDTNVLSPPNVSNIPTSAGTTQYSNAPGYGADDKSINSENNKSGIDRNNLVAGLVGAGSLISPIYKYLKSTESVSDREEIPLELEKLKYEDTSDLTRADIDARRKAVERQLGKSGLSRGQMLGQLSQASTRAGKEKAAVNQREQQIAQQVAQQNVNLSNQEKMNLQQQQLQNQIFKERGEAAREAYRGEAMSDFSKLSQIGSQKLYMQNRDKKASEMDQKTLQYMISQGYQINPDTLKLEFTGKN